MTPPTTDTEPLRNLLVPPERVAQALKTLPRPGALDEAIVTAVAEAYAGGRLTLAAERASGGLDVDRIARALDTCPQVDPDWGTTDFHFDKMYSFGSIHEKRCLPHAERILARLATPQPGEDRTNVQG